MASGFESLGRLRLQAILLLAVVFIVGALGGVAFERALEGSRAPRRPMGPPPGGIPPGLAHDLGLTAEQEARIEAVFESYRPRTDAILDEFFPRLRAVTDSARAEIRALLTPAQQEIFDRDQPPGFGKGGPPHFEGGRPPGRPGFGNRPPGPDGGPPTDCPDRRRPPPPGGPLPADRDTLGAGPPHAPSPR